MRECLNALVLSGILVACFGSRQASTATDAPCVAEGSTAGWKTYIDRAHGFCLLYPPAYKIVRNSNREKGTVDLRDSGSDIYIFFGNKTFDLPGLVDHAPTGIDFPPEPFSAGRNTFYRYGPGGGGVFYPDQYFFNLKGKTLCITFDGPYERDKTPIPSTKALEPKLLSTLRVF